MTNDKGKPNHLAREASPYLQQHAWNPVDWYPWGEEALQKSKQEDKPIIVSIGYSSCHWCHVMEHESFESDEIAEIMNSGFVCIKVDREERPDIDQVYMEAVQAMGINGGWPLNVFLTPDQKPFYGGTYFRPAAWRQLLTNVSDTYRNNRKDVFDSAEKFSEYIGQSELEKFKITADHNFVLEELAEPVKNMAERFDTVHGGFNRHPKFPMPSLWKFLLQFSGLAGEETIGDHVHFTLHKMARGGIYDQVGGGFSRYSTDERWFAPHFEKMLYDNAQLISLYSEAYRVKQDPLYREIVHQTVEFIKREMTDDSGGFYSALDADSEGEEGKFYTWKAKELDDLAGDDAGLLKSYWQVTETGNWEPGRNILAAGSDDEEFCRTHNIDPTGLRALLGKAKNTLLEARKKRVRPGLDNKMIVAWNGLMIRALADAYLAFGERDYLDLAKRTAELVSDHSGPDGNLHRLINGGETAIPGYLDDYAHMIEAYTGLYNVTFNEGWLEKAGKLSDYVLKNFYDEKEKVFFYTDSGSGALVARKKEIFDNVIPGSNSVTAMNFFNLGMMLDNREYSSVAVNMMAGIQQLVKREPEYLYNWCNLLCLLAIPVAEIAVIGNGYLEAGLTLQRNHRIDKLVMATSIQSSLPLFEGRTAINGKDTFYVCYNKTCKLPVHSAEEALGLLN